MVGLGRRVNNDHRVKRFIGIYRQFSLRVGCELEVKWGERERERDQRDVEMGGIVGCKCKEIVTTYLRMRPQCVSSTWWIERDTGEAFKAKPSLLQVRHHCHAMQCFWLRFKSYLPPSSPFFLSFRASPSTSPLPSFLCCSRPAAPPPLPLLFLFLIFLHYNTLQ